MLGVGLAGVAEILQLLLREGGDTPVAMALPIAVGGEEVGRIRWLIGVCGVIEIECSVAIAVGLQLVGDRGVEELGQEPVSAARGR